jgi:hypothetical protein
MRLIALVLLLVFMPKMAYAYVDPGFLAVFSQLLYVLFFGAIATFILKPWRYIKSLFVKAPPEKPAGEESHPEGKAE